MSLFVELNRDLALRQVQVANRHWPRAFLRLRLDRFIPFSSAAIHSGAPIGMSAAFAYGAFVFGWSSVHPRSSVASSAASFVEPFFNIEVRHSNISLMS
jgi:hypothetical protein